MQGCINLSRQESVRTWPSLVSDSSVRVDDVEPVRPTGVGDFRGVLEIIDERRKLDTKLLNAVAGYRTAFIEATRAGEGDVIF